jgi:prepilin-type N-terminal cleavage/methylation domain-containing protein
MKIRKLHSGMTLVEVVVAMAVFSTMTLGITMAFSAALKFNARNIRRDSELNLQQTSIEKSTAAGVQIYDNSLQSRTINYVNGGTVMQSVEHVTEYNAVKSSYNGSDFNFEMKTFSSVPLGSTAVTNDKSQNQYKVTFTNLSSYSVDVKLTTTGGVIYEGDADTGYRHSASIYNRSVAGYSEDASIETDDGTYTAPSGFTIGYDNTDNNYTMTVRIYANGSVISEFNVNPADFNSAKTSVTGDGELNITLNSSGNSVSYNWQ